MHLEAKARVSEEEEETSGQKQNHQPALPLTLVSRGEVSAVQALPGLGVAVVAVAVTLALSALRESPESRQTL